MTDFPRAGVAGRRIALASLLARREGYLEARVEGRSMGATLPEGSLIRVRPGRDRDFAPGDVVAIAVHERIVVHRVLSVTGARGSGRRSSHGAGALRDDQPSPVVGSSVAAERPRGRFDGGDEPAGTQKSEILLLTRGDAEILPDPPVPAAWVIGPVIEARMKEAEWMPVGPAPPRSPLLALPAAASRSLVGALLAVSPALADRTARAMLFGAYLARFVVTGGRQGRIVWPT